MTLGNVVTALEDKASKRRKGDINGAARVHVPYRDAKLTRLLQDALGGNAYAAILCCVSRAAADASHTTSTLRFASRLKSVTTAPRKNLACSRAEIFQAPMLYSPVDSHTGPQGYGDIETAAREREAARCVGGRRDAALIV